MLWNWQLLEWPQFTYDASLLADSEKRFLQGAGGTFAVLRHLDDDKRREFVVDLLCSEGIKSAEIEGELLERESLQFSIRRHFGLSVDKSKRSPKEQGMADLIFMKHMIGL